MGAAPSSIASTITGSSSSSTSSASDVVKKAVEQGKQVILHEDVLKKVGEVREIVAAFNKDDHRKLKEQVDKYNQALQAANKGGEQIIIPDNVAQSLEGFHNAVLRNLSGETFEAAMGQGYGKIYDTLSKEYKSGIEEKKQQILSSTGIKEDSDLGKDINSIIGNITSLKVKYKYFEYKYIEMNLFLILFIQKVYQSMDDFTTNVLEFNRMRDEARDKAMKDTLNAMVQIIQSADLELNPDDFKHVNTLMNKVQSDMEGKEKALQAKMNDLVTITSKNMSAFIDTLTNATKQEFQAELGKRGAPSASAPRSASMPGNASMDYPMYGGFLRSGTMLPQTFYELDKSS